jgi:DNA-binding HxlR family transcriptional regulator
MADPSPEPVPAPTAPSAAPGATAPMAAMGARAAAALATALDVVGDRWTLQVVAALLDGPRRYNEIAEAVPRVAPNVLSARLRHLESAGLLVARPYSSRPPRLRYELTARGTGLSAVIDALIGWELDAGWPEAVHDECGTVLRRGLVCPRCGVVADDGSPLGWAELEGGGVEI